MIESWYLLFTFNFHSSFVLAVFQKCMSFTVKKTSCQFFALQNCCWLYFAIDAKCLLYSLKLSVLFLERNSSFKVRFTLQKYFQNVKFYQRKQSRRLVCTNQNAAFFLAKNILCQSCACAFFKVEQPNSAVVVVCQSAQIYNKWNLFFIAFLGGTNILFGSFAVLLLGDSNDCLINFRRKLAAQKQKKMRTPLLGNIFLHTKVQSTLPFSFKATAVASQLSFHYSWSGLLPIVFLFGCTAMTSFPLHRAMIIIITSSPFYVWLAKSTIVLTVTHFIVPPFLFANKTCTYLSGGDLSC